MQELTYRQAIERSHREAVITLIAAVLVSVFFWGSVFLFEDSLLGWFGVPIWFWMSCVGGYFFSVLIVWVLVRFLMTDFDLDHFQDRER